MNLRKKEREKLPIICLKHQWLELNLATGASTGHHGKCEVSETGYNIAFPSQSLIDLNVAFPFPCPTSIIVADHNDAYPAHCLSLRELTRPSLHDT